MSSFRAVLTLSLFTDVQIFRRDSGGVADEAAFRRLVRYNDYTHDPISRQGCSGNPPFSAENAVAARDDLNPANGNYTISALGHRDHAAIDAYVFVLIDDYCAL
jgi:hypothetical protein